MQKNFPNKKMKFLFRKLKKYINFIKKFKLVCINNLFERYEKLKLINLQVVVIFTEQFGNLVHSQEKKIDSKESEEFKEIYRKWILE